MRKFLQLASHRLRSLKPVLRTLSGGTQEYSVHDNGSVLSTFLERFGVRDDRLQAIKKWFRTLQFNKKAQLHFIADFAKFLEGGASPMNACQQIIAAGVKGGATPQDIAAAAAIADAVGAGGKLADGMRDWFSDDVIAVFRLGEAGSKEALKDIVSDYLEQERALSTTIAEFMAPLKAPLMYLVMVVSGMLGIGKWMLPMLQQTLGGGQMSSEAQIVLFISNMVSDHWSEAIGIAAIFMAWLYNWMVNGRSALRRKADGIFPFSIYRAFIAMRTIRRLAILLKYGMPLQRAAMSLSRGSGGYIKWHLEKYEEAAGAGVSDLAKALDTKLMPTRLMFRLANAASAAIGSAKADAIADVAKDAGYEALRSLSKTMLVVRLTVWLLVGLVGMLTAASFMTFYSMVGSLSG